MDRFSRAQLFFRAPDWSTVQTASEPVFLAPLSLRPALPSLLPQAVARPALARDLFRSGLSARDALRFMLWRDTAGCFGVKMIETDAPSEAELNRHLPLTAPGRQRSSSVTAVLIAKDEEQTLPTALGSITDLVDDVVVVVDAGSTDATEAVARDLGARVLIRALAGDFAAQRNAGIDAVRTEWVLSIDADEQLESGLAPLLRRAMAWPGADAVSLPLLNLITERGDVPLSWPDTQIRLFRSRLRYRGALHERIDSWRRPIFLPLDGPYVRHEKSQLAQHRSTLLYHALDPSAYSRETIASVRAEAARLERDQAATSAPARGHGPTAPPPSGDRPSS